MIDFSTLDMRRSQAREAWGDQIKALCGRAPRFGFRDEGFEASIKIRDVGGIDIGHLFHNAVEIAHDKRALAEGRCGHMMLVMQMTGRAVIAQGGGVTEIGPHDIAILDTHRPFTCRFDGATRQLAAYIPAAELMTRCPANFFARPQRWSGRAGIGGLARSTLMMIARSADRFEHADAVHARRMLTDIVKHMVERERLPRDDRQQQLPDHRIRAFIDAHLADPDLGPTEIAGGCGISIRRLHRSFADTDWSTCGWIRHRRLARCREDLLDPSKDGLSITQIAFRWGFNDAAHFSRAFRSEYHQAPRDVRRRTAH
ncbi:helix-turn-helix domain-containing protein [uncultured Sphingomonas sp.]|uniref:helix-turn-helix domain-containing protein n=1 Tax=uncultured Sphingomonas sp. TaxID=158754 RepID=UPI0035C9F66C